MCVCLFNILINLINSRPLIAKRWPNIIIPESWFMNIFSSKKKLILLCLTHKNTVSEWMNRKDPSIVQQALFVPEQLLLKLRVRDAIYEKAMIEWTNELRMHLIFQPLFKAIINSGNQSSLNTLRFSFSFSLYRFIVMQLLALVD